MKMKAVIVFTVLVAFASSKPVHKNSKHGTTLAGTIEERLAALELKYEEKLSSQEKKIAKLENQLDAYDGRTRRQVFAEPEIAFHAYVSNRLEHIGNGQIVVFDHVVTNVDTTQSASGYSSSTGVFTAPISGLYVFAMHLVGGLSHTMHFAFYKEQSPVVSAYLHGGADNDFDSGSADMIVSLVKGETVSVRHTHTDHALEGTWQNAGQSMFSGFLLRSHDDGETVVG